MKKYIILLDLLVILHGCVCSLEHSFKDNVIKTVEDYNKQIIDKELELKYVDSKIKASLKELSGGILNKVQYNVETDENLSEVKKEVARLKVSLGHTAERLRTCEISLQREQEVKSKDKDSPSLWSQFIGNNNSNLWDKVKQIPQQVTMFFSEKDFKKN